jgi:hypothetical protein
MSKTASQIAFDGLGAIIVAALSPQAVLFNARVDERLAKAGQSATIVNWVWSRRAPVETGRQFGQGVGLDVVDFNRAFNLEIVCRAASDETMAQAVADVDALVMEVRAALMPGPSVPDPTHGGIVRHYVSVASAQDATEAFAGAARVAARVLTITAHLRAIGDPD